MKNKKHLPNQNEFHRESLNPQFPNEYVMVACPTYFGKKYALEAYISAFNDFTYPNKELFMVDNTGDGLRYYEHLLGLGVPCAHINPVRDWQKTLAMCWKRILKEAKTKRCKWVCSIEQDNICPPLTLDTLLNVAGYCSAVHVAHSYPWHKFQSPHGLLLGLGCNLILTELLDEIFARQRWLTDAFEAELFEYPKACHYPSVELHNLLDIKHLDDDQSAEYYIFPHETIPEFTPGTTQELKPPKWDVGVAEQGA